MTKTICKLNLRFLFITILLVSLCSGCSNDSPTDKVYGLNEKFTIDNNTFALDKVLFDPEFDTEDSKGYVVYFSYKDEKAGNDHSKKQDSIFVMRTFDFNLIDGDNIIEPVKITFYLTIGEENEEYLIFTYKLKNGEQFPKAGNFIRINKDINKIYSIDLSGISITETYER
ncbi:MAG: hypothetical protein LBD17_03990 [Endomicrobium sp.]|jgi:hypothetical protein|nr:hypothetical protein [Endomicrobium sp.]